MKVLRRAASALMFVLVMAYLAFAPGFFLPALRENAYAQWLKGKPMEYTGIIKVWHVVEFKPYRGSLSTLLKAWGNKIQKKNFGIFFEILPMTSEEAQARISRGERPDMLSFYSGYCDAQDLREIPFFDLDLKGDLQRSGQEEGVRGVAYAMSGHCLLLRTEYLQERSVTLPEEITKETLDTMQRELTYERGRKKTKIAGLSGDAVMAYMSGARQPVEPFDSFLNGTSAMAVADLRAVGDLKRKMEQGKGFSFSALPLPEYTPLVQYLGIDRRMEEEKLPYAIAFIELALEEPSQASLFELGLLPVKAVEPKDAQTVEPIVSALAEALKEPAVPKTFLYKIRRDQLYEAAHDALSGAPEENFRDRLKELVPALKIK